MTKKKQKEEVWYYDACVLDLPKTYADMINTKHPRKNIISHLALGEAYANLHIKKGEEAVNSFVSLIEKMRGFGCVLVENDGVEKQLKKVNEELERLSITDSIHLATAIKHNSNIFKTNDNDFYGCKKKICNFVCENFSIKNFSISKTKY